jgi:hypothetical protein
MCYQQPETKVCRDGWGRFKVEGGSRSLYLLALPRLQPELAESYAQDLHREYVKDRDVKWDNSDNEKSSLYPVPRGLFRTEPLSSTELIESEIDVGALPHQGDRVK